MLFGLRELNSNNMCTSTIFDKFAWIYNPLVKPFLNYERFAKEIRDISKLDKSSKILDVGGGTGLTAEYLVDYAENLTVIDPSKEMMSRIKSKNIDKVMGFIQDINYQDESFDVIYCVDSFHHFVNGHNKNNYESVLDTCIKQLLRVLKKHGKIIIIDINKERFGGKFIKFLENQIMRWGSKFYSPKELTDLFMRYKTNANIISTNGSFYTICITKI